MDPQPRQGDEFIITIKTDNAGTSNSTSIAIPVAGSGYNYQVDWNDDGVYEQSGLTGNATWNYGIAGTYTIRIQGAFPRIHFNNGGDCLKLLSIDQWGSIAWSSMANAFMGCSNMTCTATDAPNLSAVTSMANMFRNCTQFNGAIGNWDVGNVTNMGSMFWNAGAFNQPIGNWNVGNVTIMAIMFQNASSFNQPIGNWNVGKVNNMGLMFQGAGAFNQPIGNWTLNPNVDMASMLNNSGMDCLNYSATLIGWAANPATPNGRTLGATGRQYGANAVSARNSLLAEGWSISGDTPLGAAISGATTGCGSVTLTASGGSTYQWSGGNTPNEAENTFTTSGMYTVTVTNAIGCTATAGTTVTINHSTSNTTTETACGSYTWAVNGQTYTASGTYSETSTNAAGCSHTETLQLTINYSTAYTCPEAQTLALGTTCSAELPD